MNRGRGNGSSKPTCLKDRGKRLLKVSSLGIIAREYRIVHTWERAVVLDKIRGTTEELCQFAGAPQQLLALVRGERVRGGRGLGEGDGWMGHGRRSVEGRDRVTHRTRRRLLWVIKTARSKSPSLQTTKRVDAPLRRVGTDYRSVASPDDHQTQ